MTVEELFVNIKGDAILKGVTLSCSGGITALLGVNGSGKSTLLRAVMGLVPIASGTVRVVGYEVPRQVKLARRQMGYLAQRSSFPGRMTTLEALDYAAWLQKMEPRRSWKRIEELLEGFSLGELRHQRVGALFGGTLQRLLLAQAIIHEPSLLLLDEPTVGLDLTQQAAFRSIIAELARESTVVLATHHSEDVERLADRAVLLSGGRLIWDGSVGDLEALSAGSCYGADRGSRIEASIAELVESDDGGDGGSVREGRQPQEVSS
ncbi:ABC transporter ATP-binding protein [Actinomyces bowdenii]|uniref:ABC transporter ATP-binding protein n=1 Tax=Actinomyces bowdenii TaxID=131109 RepID=UPI001ABD13D2|nr:ABC transporter ATP-binding protein [Actinomyces bowdenii]MBO3725598.1 ABC transporter ATP-binding protein [Actinomyces bowdenii]